MTKCLHIFEGGEGGRGWKACENSQLGKCNRSLLHNSVCERVLTECASRHNCCSGGDKMSAYLGAEGGMGKSSWNQSGAAVHAPHSDPLSCSYLGSFGLVSSPNCCFGQICVKLVSLNCWCKETPNIELLGNLIGFADNLVPTILTRTEVFECFFSM